MTTVINTPPATNDNYTSGVAAVVITILILGTLLFVFFSYILPMIRGNQQQSKEPATSIEVKIPTPEPAPTPAPY